MVTVAGKIPEDLHSLLESEATRKRVSKAAILREALETRLKKSTAQNEPSAYDLVRHLSGTLQGPPDLATDPKYLKGLGQ